MGGRYFQEVVRKLPGENVKLACTAEEKIVHIESAMAKFTLLSMNAAEFPTIQPLEGNLDFAIKDNILRDLIKKTVFACSTDEARPVFTGCSLEVTENKVTMAATNTHRLSVKSETFDQSIGNIKVIIPSRILQELLHNMSSDNAQYIIDVLKNIDSKTCRIGLNQPLSPASIQEEDDDSFVYIVTPVRTNH